MRIALFHATLPERGRKPGGVEAAVHRLASALAQGGDDLVTVYSTGPCPDGARYEHRRLGHRRRDGYRSWLGSRAGRLSVLPLYLNLVDFGDHDVVHLHGDDWFFFRRRRPTVRTLHGSALREAQTAGSWKRRLAQFGVFPLEYLSARLATLPLAIGRDTARIYRVPTIVDNGVDTELFAPGEKTRHPSVLFVGTWKGRKRGEIVHRVFTTQIRPAIPEAKLTMVSDWCAPGEGVDHLRFADDRALAGLYRRSWVFAYPSRYEGFGMPYLEALASGTAIVTTPNQGGVEVLQDGRYGVLAGDRNFGSQVVELLLDPARRRALEEEGRRHAESFTWAAVAARHRALYEGVVNRVG